MRGVQARARVDALAETDPEHAARLARAIAHPWYRCQALTAVARVHPSRNAVKRLLVEALEAAHAQDEPNRIVSVASWPLGVLVEFDVAWAVEATKSLVEVIAREPHSLRRLDGLYALLKAGVACEPVRVLLIPPIVEAAAAGHGWRTERTASFAAMALSPHDRRAARALLATQPMTRFKVRAIEAIDLARLAEGA